MKKFNKMESNLICDALDYYVAHLEADIKELEEKGRTSIFAPGFYPMVKDELVSKIKKDMTKKDKWQ
tara:strand:+ start:803 stop:1003 length:201 start_codon:yes stop_codon:yes gene_type:complete